MIPQLHGRDPIRRPGDAVTINPIAATAITPKRGSLSPSPAGSRSPSLDRHTCRRRKTAFSGSADPLDSPRGALESGGGYRAAATSATDGTAPAASVALDRVGG